MITGQVTNDELIGRIFANFCIGIKKVLSSGYSLSTVTHFTIDLRHSFSFLMATLIHTFVTLDVHLRTKKKGSKCTPMNILL
jgi:hypothetical protein